MHRLTKLKEGWAPTLAVIDKDEEDAPTQLSAELSAVLHAESSTLEECWQASDTAPVAWVPDRGCLPRPTPEAICKAAASFSEATAYSAEGLHPRHVTLLCVQGLAVLAMLIEVIKRIGLLPRPLRLLVFVLIPKSKGGFRPILQQPMLMRLWERIRRGDLGEYMERTMRPYYSFAKGQACTDVVWRQTARTEAALAKGEVVAAFTCDSQKFYERFDLALLRGRATALRMPGPIVKLTYNTWRGPRLVRQGRQVCDHVSFAICGLPPGSGLNDCFVRAYCTAPLDAFTLRCPMVSLDQSIDDSVIIAQGQHDQVRRDIVDAAAELQVTVEVELTSVIAPGKIGISATSGKLALEIARGIRRLLPNPGNGSGGGFPVG